METFEISEKEKRTVNMFATHPLQSYEWGEFRKKTGVTVKRIGIKKGSNVSNTISITLHRIPHTPYRIGYFPKGSFPTKDDLNAIYEVAKRNHCIFVQLEPNSLVEKLEKDNPNWMNILSANHCLLSFHPLFTKYSFILNLAPSEEELLQNMHSKTRYNIRLATRKGVYVEEDNSEKGFGEYMRLTHETTVRQKFYAHSPSYHRKLWETLPKDNDTSRLTYHLFHARYKEENGEVHTLVSWVLFVFHDTLYYPYGASGSYHREFMASNLMAFEAIRFGKKLGLKKFDMWGALGPDPDPKDPWYGFHRFKEGYGAQLTEFIGSYDLVVHQNLYQLYKAADKIRWALLRLKK